MQKFILHVATTYEGCWRDFMYKVDKMFVGHIPDRLLEELKHMSRVDQDVCDTYLAKNEMRRTKLQQEQEAHAAKVARWIERRDEGNRKELERRQARKQRMIQAQKESERVATDIYIASMQNTWDAEVESIKQRREKELMFVI